MTRAQAAIDVLLILALFFFFQFALAAAGVPQILQYFFPSLGILWVNVCYGSLLLIAIAVIVYLRRQTAADLALVRTSAGRLATSTIIAVPLCYLGIFITVPLYVWLAGLDLESMAKERFEFFEIVPHLTFWQAAAFSAFVGVHEEILFRGFILGRLQALFRSNIAAVLVCSIVFGLLHFYQGPIGVVQTATVGMVLATVVIRTRSLWPAILAHAAFDTIGLTLIPLLQESFKDVLEQLTTTQATSAA